jgi:molybdopterin-guanine dinucleotide biosynthesis protein A
MAINSIKPDLTGFVLAGGKSSRMGADKSALPIESETFLTRAAGVLQTVCATVKIVLRQTQTPEIDLPVVRDVYRERGALGGIHAALKDCETEFAFVLAVDLPLVTPAAIKYLAEIAIPKNLSAIVPRQSDGRFQPLCAIYRRADCLPVAEKMLAFEQSASMRDFLKPISVHFVPQEEIAVSENLFFNVNAPADLEILPQKKKE